PGKARVADELPLTRLLRFFVEDIARNNPETGGKRLNNARVRRLGQRIWDKANPYQVIKYQHKYKTIICYPPNNKYNQDEYRKT
ncbi:MAG: hypothetical protein GDA44_05545, partial [Prochloron sp. SP5CPC1]|nr:hypothetical protein [Candidatus Paraprochloron terpiosi SP5CPC1]